LAVDTTGQTLSLALLAGDKVLVSSPKRRRPHDETLFSETEKLLGRAKLKLEDLHAVAAASGPGRFTGIRVGLTFASMLGAVLDVPAIGASLLEARARREPPALLTGQRFYAILEGFQGEKFIQGFQWRKGRLLPLGEPEWIESGRVQKRLRQAHKQGVVLSGPVQAQDLLACAQERLSRGAKDSAIPLYLKPASYERKK
jgi:tRNA threonylcarbamoyl adenosine modification protein YeaZ